MLPILLMGLLSSFSVMAFSADNQFEYKLKTAYVYNVLKYIEWPEGVADGNNQLRLCVAGEGPVAPLLSSLQDKLVGERAIEVTRVDTTGQLKGCNALYLAQSIEPKVESYLKKASQDVLTISDIEAFVEQKGMVGFAIDGNRVLVEVNLQEIKLHGMEASAQLLEVAKIIR